MSHGSLRLLVALSATSLMLIISGDLINGPQPKSAAESPGAITASSLPHNTLTETILNVEPIGQIGGPILALEIQGNYAYLGVGTHLIILDISDPRFPYAIGKYASPDSIKDLAIAGNYAYLVNWDSGLHIVNIANPRQPSEAAFIDTPPYPAAIVVAGDYAYLLAGGLQIIDVSDPVHPINVSFSAWSWHQGDIAVSGRYVYATDDFDGVLNILDVSNPVTPTQVGTYFDKMGSAAKVAISGTLAYIGDRGSGIHVIDVTHPASPTWISLYHNPRPLASMVVSGSYAYLSEGNGGLRLVDVSSPTAMHEVGFYSLPRTAWLVAVNGPYSFIADMSNLHIIDTASPTNPNQIGLYASVGDVWRTAVSGKYVYADDTTGLKIINVASPPNLTLAGTYTSSAQGVVISDHYAYIGSNDGLYILDLGNLPTLVALGIYKTQTPVSDVAVSGDYAYVLTGPGDYGKEYGLYIVNITDKTAPVGASSYTAVWIPGRIEVREGYTYIANGFGLCIIDIRNPYSPTMASFVSVPHSALDLALVDHYAFVADMQDLRIIDIASPTHPIEVGSYGAGAFQDIRSLAASDQYVYIGDTIVGLHIIDVTNPISPTEAGTYTPGQYLRDVAALGNSVYLANGYDGLAVLWFAPPISASFANSGGMLTSTLDCTSYIFGVNTFTETVTITHTARFPGNIPPTNNFVGIGHTFEVSAMYSGTQQPAQPMQPYTVIVHYTDAEKSVAIENALALYYWDGNQWMKEDSSMVDTELNTLTAMPNHFSLFTVLGDTYRFYLPIIRR